MSAQELKPGFEMSVGLLTDMAAWLAKSRLLHVALALETGNVNLACIEFLDQQSGALAMRRNLEAQRSVFRHFAKSRKVQCEVLPMLETMLRANDLFVAELGQTIAAIRRAYAERCFL